MKVRSNILNIHDYETAGGKNLIKEYLDKLSIEDKTTGYTIRNHIKKKGISAFNGFNTRQLKKKLWEIKFSKNRLMYVIADEDNIYFVHACKKQKGKAEHFELQKAIVRVKELERALNKKLI